MTEDSAATLPMQTGPDTERLDLPAPGPGRGRWLALAGLIVLAAAAAFLATRRAPAPETAVAVAVAPEAPFAAQDVVGLARLMPRGDVAVVAAPYGSGDARVAELLVAEGAQVRKGQPLARLDNQAALESAVLAARAELAVREAALVQVKATVASSRDEARAALDQARSAATEAATSLTRTEALHRRGVATTATLEAVRASAEATRLAVIRAEATLARFTPAALAAQPDVTVAERNLAAAAANLARAELDLARALVVAPISGTVLEVIARPGGKPGTEGILTMGDLGRMRAEAEIWQDRIGLVQPGQRVTLLSRAFAAPLSGRVDSIGLTVGRQGLISDDSAANTDARVVKVRITLDPEASRRAARFTGLEVIAHIDTAPGSGAAATPKAAAGAAP